MDALLEDVVQIHREATARLIRWLASRKDLADRIRELPTDRYMYSLHDSLCNLLRENEEG